MSVARRIGMQSGDRPTGLAGIVTWCELSGIALTLWECETVASMSSSYVAALNTYRDEDELPPWMPAGEREKLEQSIAEFNADFGHMSDSPEKGKH